MTYIFKTTTTMKPYNNKNWWIDSDIISEKRIERVREYRDIARA